MSPQTTEETPHGVRNLSRGGEHAGTRNQRCSTEPESAPSRREDQASGACRSSSAVRTPVHADAVVRFRHTVVTSATISSCCRPAPREGARALSFAATPQHNCPFALTTHPLSSLLAVGCFSAGRAGPGGPPDAGCTPARCTGPGPGSGRRARKVTPPDVLRQRPLLEDFFLRHVVQDELVVVAHRRQGVSPSGEKTWM